MKFWKIGLLLLGFLLLGLVLAACNVNDASEPRTDVTLDPSPIAQFDYRAADADADGEPTPEPERVILAPRPGVMPENVPPSPVPDAAPPSDEGATQAPDTAAEATAPPAEQPPGVPDAGISTPTSNFEEIQALTDNPTLAVQVEMDTTCFLAEDFIPFRFIVTSLETAPIYFYRNGRWRLSINNSPLGPDLSSLEPTIRDDFVELEPSGTFVQEEEDLGLWALSLGPNAGVPSSPSGLGLPAGNYWVTFVYDNDQDGLREQPDGTFLIDRAAWRGTAVAPEVRFSVVNDLSEC